MRSLILCCLSPAAALLAQTPPALTHGPFRGHVDGTSMHVWARASEPGAFTLRLVAADGDVVTANANADAAHDLTLHFTVPGLEAASLYDATILSGERVVHQEPGAWATAMADDASAVTIAFGSCSSDTGFKDQPIWGRILARSPHALVLLGDTPYIDAGTVEARRRRHREFFAFPPVRAALRAIPTWTTWDDHDYTANDEFGAVKGSETARPVFVDYHAHAAYGDGQRGIYTSFRRGPLEVFLLDARSFADVEQSPLAPGERSLLGTAQIAWLQQALLASTAAVKVLACGMVWNEGVRTNKKDCWGNWLPERDGLFRWLGEQRIAGVVLIGGDVHRSRVILHPTRAVVGYDVPEFITSPLAQNVIETNAVAVPGLAFDAGESHSCLFLEVARTGEDGVVRAVFQAGDGREFHVRELSFASLQRADAAAHYRRAAQLLKAQFGESGERMPFPEHGNNVLPIGDSEACSTEWRAAVGSAKAAFAEWDLAVAEPLCRFRSTSSEPLLPEYMQSLLLPLSQLLLLRCADAMQAVADRQPERFLRDCEVMLATARHLQQEPGVVAWSQAASVEAQVLDLRQLARPAFGDTGDVALRDLLRTHLARRASVAAGVAAARIESFRLFEGTLQALHLKDGMQSKVARRFGAEVRRQFVANVGPVFAVGEAIGAAVTPEQRSELRQRTQELMARAKAARDAVQAMETAKVPEAAMASALALELTRLLLPELSRCVEQWNEVTLLLTAAVQ